VYRRLFGDTLAVRDERCARQIDAATCGLHAVRNAALLCVGDSPSANTRCDGATALSELADLARSATAYRRDACRCSDCHDKRVTRRWATLLEHMAARLAAPRSDDPLLPRDARDDVPLFLLPNPTPTSELKRVFKRCRDDWRAAHGGPASVRAEASAASQASGMQRRSPTRPPKATATTPTCGKRPSAGESRAWT
jgi:hypothetical protein